MHCFAAFEIGIDFINDNLCVTTDNWITTDNFTELLSVVIQYGWKSQQELTLDVLNL